MGYVDGINREQIFMLSLEELVPENSECRVIDCFCEKLDMKKLGFEHSETKSEGRPPFAPEDLLKLYLYGYLNRIDSSGKLAKEAKRNVEIIWLLKGITPSKRVLCYFKEHNREALRNVFLEFNCFYRQIGLFGKKTIALDSVKIKANNSKKKNYNEKTVDKTIEKTVARIEEYMAILDEADKNDGYEEEHDLTSEQVKEIIDKLEAKKEKFESIREELKNTDDTQISATDPDARCMKQGSGKGMDISYNTQVVTEEKSKMIVDYDTTNEGSDKGHVAEKGNSAKEFLQTDEIVLLADTGYYDGKEILEAEANGITCLIPKGKPTNQNSAPDYRRDKFIFDEKKNVYICPQGQTLRFTHKTVDSNGDEAFVYENCSACSICPYREKCTSGKYRKIQRKYFQSDIDKINARFLKRKGEYKKRQEIIEHQFGTIKWVWGFDRYYVRGIQAVSAENALLFTAYNLRRAINILGIDKIIEAMHAINQTHSDFCLVALNHFNRFWKINRYLLA